MGIGNKLEVAQQEIVASLRHMPPSSRFQVVVYNRHAETLKLGESSTMASINEPMIQQVAKLLSELTPEGGNDHLHALREAIALQPDVICLLTDADDLTLELVKTVTKWNRGQSSINAVTIGSAPRHTMQALAASNRGECKMISLR
jgi:hypothetical protein